MDDFTFSLFTDTGGIILLDPEHADALGDDDYVLVRLVEETGDYWAVE